MAGGVIVTGIIAVSAVMSIVAAIVAAIMAMLSTILMVVGIVAGVAVLGLVLPPIIRAIGDVKTQRVLADYRASAHPQGAALEAVQDAAPAELEDMRRRLQMLELRTAPVNRELEH